METQLFLIKIFLSKKRKHVSLIKHLVFLLILLMPVKNDLKKIYWNIEKVISLSTVQKNIHYSLKKIK